MDETQWLQPVVDRYKQYFGDTANLIFDVGSRDGDDGQFLREQLNGETVYAIDANPRAIKTIKHRHKDFNVIYTAVSDYDGTTEFVQILSDDKDHAGSSSIKNFSFFEGATYRTLEVPVARMDTLLHEHGLQDQILDVVKVDIEGYSYEFIVGLGDLIDNVKLFHLETEMFWRHDGHKDNNKVIDLMTSKGFLLCETIYQWEGIQDQIWINSRFIR